MGRGDWRGCWTWYLLVDSATWTLAVCFFARGPTCLTLAS